MAIFSLIAKLGLDKTGFDAGLDSAGKRVSAFGGHLKSHLAGAFGAAALIAAGQAALEYAENIGRAAAELGISTDTAQQLGLAARLAGGDIGTIAGKFERLRKAASEAIGKGKAGPFAEFGISLEELKRGRPEELFERIALAVDHLNEQPRQLKAFFDIFGTKGAGEVIRVMQHLEKSKEEGLLISPKDIENAKAFEERIKILKTQLYATLATGGPLKKLRDLLLLSVPGYKKTKEQRQVAEAEEEAKNTANDEKARQLARDLQLKAEIGSTNDRLAAQEEKNRKANLDDQQEINELLEKQYDLFDRIRHLEKAGEGQGLEAAMARLDVAVAQAGIDKLVRAAEARKPEEEKKEKQLRQRPSDLLGKIGGTVGGGDATQTRLNEMVRELKILNRRLGFQGVRIDGEL